MNTKTVKDFNLWHVEMSAVYNFTSELDNVTKIVLIVRN